jgi:tetratricopeptide (TPR) repeat protein
LTGSKAYRPALFLRCHSTVITPEYRMHRIVKLHSHIIIIALFSLVGGSQQLIAQTRPTSEQVAIEKKLIEGEKYTFLGEWEKAEPIFRSILEEDVQNSAACYQLSRTLLATGKSTDALSYIRKAIRIEPDNEWYLIMEGDIHEKIGDLHAMMDIYDRLIALQPKKPQYYEMQISLCKRTASPLRLLATLDKYESLMGISESITRNRFETLDVLGRTEEAMQAIHRLTEVYPLNTSYKYLAASYAKKIGREEAATTYYKAILQLDPDDSRAKLALAGTTKQEGDKAGYLQSIVPIISDPGVEIDVKLGELIPYVIEYSKSKEAALGEALLHVIQKLKTSHPREAKVYAIEGDMLSQMGKDKPAIESYKQATALNDNIYVVWEQLIALLLRSHQYDELQVQSTNAIDIFPNQGYLYYASGYAYYKQKQLSDAMDMLTQALLMTGKNLGQKVNVLNLMAMVYDEQGDVDKSIASFESSLGINPHHPETMAYYALSLSKRISRSDRALSLADQLVKDGRTEGYLHRIIAEVYYNQQEFLKANQSIQFVLKEGPDGSGYNLAGDIAVKLGNKEEAVRHWQKALELGYMEAAVKQKIAEHKTQ